MSASTLYKADGFLQGVYQYKVVSFSGATQIALLNTAPPTVIPAPPAGKSIILQSVVVYYTGTTPTETSGHPVLELLYANSAVGIQTTWTLSSQSNPNMSLMGLESYANKGADFGALLTSKAVQLGLSTGLNGVANDTTITVHIIYFIV